MGRHIRNRKDEIVQGSRRDDFIHTGEGNDRVNGGAGNDLILANGGNDIVDGGAGVDLVSAGNGNDVAIFVAAENSGPRWRLPDFYDGGNGTDELRVVLTSAEWAKADVRADILAYAGFLEAGGKGIFKFQSLNFAASKFETLNLVVDGLSIDPRGDPAQVIDLSASTQDETVQTGAGDDIVRTGAGSDVINTGAGDDLIESGAGDDVVTIGDGNDFVRTGDGNDTVIAGLGGGDDIIDGGAGVDLVAYDSIAFGIAIDLREVDRSGLDLGAGRTTADLLAGKPYPANTPVGMTTAIDPQNSPGIGIDLLIGFENARGGSGNDRITGSNTANALYGAAGNDELNGLEGDDVLHGNAGADALNGGAGTDILYGGDGADTFDGGAGSDTVVLDGSSTEYEFVADGQGGYTIIRNGEPQTSWESMKSIEAVTFSDTTLPTWAITDFNFIVGDDSAEVLDGTPGRDNIEGKGGDDSIFGNDEEDWMTGGAGNDLIVGSTGTYDDDNFVWDAVDYMREGGPQGITVNLAAQTATDSFGNVDTLVSIERLFATNFADFITGSDKGEGFDPHGGDDFIDGGAGWDHLMYQLSEEQGGTSGIIATFSASVEGAGTVSDPFGDTDAFVNIEAVRGTRFDDLFIGGAGSQEFRGHGGADSFDGGDGYDLIRYSDDAAYGGLGGIAVDMEVLDPEGYATLVDGFGANDRLKNIEEIRGTGATDLMLGDGMANSFRGGGGADTLEGRGGNDDLWGGLGDDTLRGGAGEDDVIGEAGNDTINGGAGNDWLVGGEGDDLFEFSAGSGADTIADFETGIDSISLGASIGIASISYANVSGDSADDTIIALSDGGLVTLLDATVLQAEFLFI